MAELRRLCLSVSHLSVFREHTGRCSCVGGYGKIGKGKTIQRWRCQACHTTFSCGRGTPLFYLKSPAEQVEMVLWFLAEGVDQMIERVRQQGVKFEAMAVDGF